MNISEVRNQYPQYQDLSDQQLAEGLHKKFYADMDFGEFSGKIGYSVEPVEPPKPVDPVDTMAEKVGDNVLTPEETAEFKAGAVPDYQEQQIVNQIVEPASEPSQATPEQIDQIGFNSPLLGGMGTEQQREDEQAPLNIAAESAYGVANEAVDALEPFFMSPAEEKAMRAKHPNLMAARYAAASLLLPGVSEKLASPEELEKFTSKSKAEQQQEILGLAAGYAIFGGAMKGATALLGAAVKRYPILAAKDWWSGLFGDKAGKYGSNWLRKMTNKERGLVVQNMDEAIKGMEAQGMSEGQIFREIKKTFGNEKAYNRFAEQQGIKPKTEPVKPESKPVVPEELIKPETEPVVQEMKPEVVEQIKQPEKPIVPVTESKIELVSEPVEPVEVGETDKPKIELVKPKEVANETPETSPEPDKPVLVDGVVDKSGGGVVGGDKKPGSNKKPNKNKTIKPQTVGSSINFDVTGVNDTFEIKNEAGSSILGYLKNQDFPNESSKPDRGELFLTKVIESERMKGIGQSLNEDAIRLMSENGTKTVNLHATSPGGEKIVKNLIKKGFISEPIKTGVGKTEHTITLDTTTTPDVKSEHESQEIKDIKSTVQRSKFARQKDAPGVQELSEQRTEKAEPPQRPTPSRPPEKQSKQSVTEEGLAGLSEEQLAELSSKVKRQAGSAVPETEPSDADKNIGRSWDSRWGKQTIESKDSIGAGDYYNVRSEDGAVRVYRAENMEQTIKKNEYELTDEYKKEVENKKEFNRRAKEVEAKIKAKIEQHIAEIHEFGSDKSNLTKGRFVKTLTGVTVNYKKQSLTRKEWIDQLVNDEGRTIKGVGADRRLTTKDDAWLNQKDLTKTGMDYAEYLINKKKTGLSSKLKTRIAETKAQKEHAKKTVSDERIPSLLNEAGDQGAIVHPSTKKPGKWQVTRWDNRGFSGDTTLETKEKAIDLAISDGYRTPDTDGVFKKTSRSDEFLNGVAELEKARAEWERASKKMEAEKSDEVEIETKSEDEKVVSVDMGKWREQNLKPKEQKEYLLAEVDKAIEDAIKNSEYSQMSREQFDTHRTEMLKNDGKSKGVDIAKSLKGNWEAGQFKYIFEVPNDGTFTILADSLFDFRESVKGDFPLSSLKTKFKESTEGQINHATTNKKMKEIFGADTKLIKPDMLDALIAKADKMIPTTKSGKKLKVFKPGVGKERYLEWLQLQDITPEVKAKIKEVITGKATTKVQGKKSESTMPKPDSRLTTKEEISKRIKEIDRKIDELSSGSDKTFLKREQAIKKLYSRKESLSDRKEPKPKKTGTSAYASTDSFADIPAIMDMPEIVQLAKDLLNGKYPKIVKKFRSAQWQGVFRPVGDGKIELLADLFKDPQQAQKTLAHEIGHLVDYLPDHMMARGNILGRIASLKNYMKHTMPGKPGGLGELTKEEKKFLKDIAKNLAGKKANAWIDEEIVTTMPITPDDVLNIWNSVAAEEISPKLVDYAKGLSTAQKKSIVKEALKGRVASELEKFATEVRTKTGKKILAESSGSAKDIGKIYKGLINEEIKKRFILESKVIMDELKAFTQAWKPFDPLMDAKHTKYRYSGVELYADAVSAIITNPRFLQNKAPTFYKAWFNYLGNKPQAKRAYEDIQRLIKTGDENIAVKRQEDVFNMFQRGHEKRKEIGTDKHVKKTDVIDNLMTWFVNRDHAVLKKIRKVENNKGANGDLTKQAKQARKTRAMLEESKNLASEIDVYLRDFNNNILEPLKSSDISADELGYYLFERHVMDGRSDIANPLGHTPETSKKDLSHIEQSWGPEKTAKIKELATEFRKIRQELLFPVLRESGIATDKLMDHIEDYSNYVTISVIDYLDGELGSGVGASIFKQVGTFNEAENPLIPTVLKDISLIRAARINMIKQEIEGLLSHPNIALIEPADMQKSAVILGMKVPKESTDPWKSLFTVMHKGEPKHFYISKRIADMFDHSPVEQQMAVKLFRAIGQPVREILVSKNPIWMLRNVPRDFLTTAKNLSEVKLRNLPELAGYYKEAWPEVIAEVFKGLSSPDLRVMKTNKMIPKQRMWSGYDETMETELDRMVKDFDLSPASADGYAGVIGKFKKIWDTADHAGSVSELLGKLAAYKYLKANSSKSVQEIGMVVRNRAGTPNITSTGTLQPFTNNMFMFSNVGKEGIRATYRSIKEDAGGYVWKTFWLNFAPKLVLAGIGSGAVLAAMEGMVSDDGNGEALKRTAKKAQRMVRGISEYDLSHYNCIPLYLRKDGKSVYLRIPEDYEGQFFGTLAYKIMSGKFFDNDGLLNAISSGNPYQMHPLLTELGHLTTYYLNSNNPVDDYRGTPILTSQEMKVGGKPAAARLLKHSWSGLGGNIIYRPAWDALETKRDEWEKFLTSFPGNLLGTFVKVSDRGITEEINAEFKALDKAKAEVSIDLRKVEIKFANGEVVTADEIAKFAQQPNRQVGKNIQNLMLKATGRVYMKALASAPSAEKTAIIIRKMLEDNFIQEQAIKE